MSSKRALAQRQGAIVLMALGAAVLYGFVAQGPKPLPNVGPGRRVNGRPVVQWCQRRSPGSLGPRICWWSYADDPDHRPIRG